MKQSENKEYDVLQILIHSDYRDILPCLTERIDLVLTDPPYGSTNNVWDKVPIDFIKHVEPLNVGSVVTTADMRYACFLIDRWGANFSHDLVWGKTVGSGQLNINRQPLRKHEHVLVFRFIKAIYNRVKTKGHTPYKIKRDIKTEQCYSSQKPNEAVNLGERDTGSILTISNPRIKKGHPTQKPLKLYRDLADLYSNKGSVLLDPFSGSGTILDVEGRYCIGVEQDDRYYRIACDSRTGRIVEKERLIGTPLQYLIPLLSNTEYTVFSSACEKVI